MKHQRFYVAGPISSKASPLTIPSLELVNQLKRVLRLVPGDEVFLFGKSDANYSMQLRVAIKSYEKDSVAFDVLSEEKCPAEPQRETRLFAAVVKKDNFEWIVQKATELGVSHIVPIISDRTEKQGLNENRLTKVSIEAAEQSGRCSVPVIHDILKLADAVDNYSMQNAIVWEPTAEKFDKNELHTIDSILIGPEGGWTERELELFKEKGIKVRSLGPQVLRAETAVVAALSQIVF